ncbi:MAG: hypothetical protein JJ868_17280 [Shimia sp.]|uniref:hypothetical protein n=1 Tax=Shimia sp. TaxID=1954381 RepID=UPI001B01A369|nr:hypothetical protein [Shimia sp.]MBO6899125.1 hypothetical protein [Shimia sp.]
MENTILSENQPVLKNNPFAVRHRLKPIREVVGERILQHRWRDDVPEIVHVFRGGFSEYIYSGRLGEHLDEYLYEYIIGELDDNNFDLTEEQRSAFVEFVQVLLPIVEDGIEAYMEALSFDLDPHVLALSERLAGDAAAYRPTQDVKQKTLKERILEKRAR